MRRDDASTRCGDAHLFCEIASLQWPFSRFTPSDHAHAQSGSRKGYRVSNKITPKVMVLDRARGIPDQTMFWYHRGARINRYFLPANEIGTGWCTGCTLLANGTEILGRGCDGTGIWKSICGMLGSNGESDGSDCETGLCSDLTACLKQYASIADTNWSRRWLATTVPTPEKESIRSAIAIFLTRFICCQTSQFTPKVKNELEMSESLHDGCGSTGAATPVPDLRAGTWVGVHCESVNRIHASTVESSSGAFSGSYCW